MLCNVRIGRQVFWGWVGWKVWEVIAPFEAIKKNGNLEGAFVRISKLLNSESNSQLFHEKNFWSTSDIKLLSNRVQDRRLGLSVTRWLDYFSIFCHLLQTKICPNTYVFAKLGAKFCRVLNERSKNWQRYFLYFAKPNQCLIKITRYSIALILGPLVQQPLTICDLFQEPLS